jgi:hypothetical protein
MWLWLNLARNHVPKQPLKGLFDATSIFKLATVAFKVFCIWKNIKIIYFFIFKNLFLTSAHQNNTKTLKN